MIFRRDFPVAFVVVLLFAMFIPAPAHADACAAAKREMAFGEAALEDAKDEAGYKRAAQEFKQATVNAPQCAAAFFNLGVVQEKAGAYGAAKVAFERYLTFAPGASDRGAVEKKIFKLEYRIKRAISHTNLVGLWREGEKDSPHKDECRYLRFRLSGGPTKFFANEFHFKCGNFGNDLTELVFNVDGTQVSGSIRRDMSWWQNPPPRSQWRCPFKGNVSDGGKTITGYCDTPMPNGATGNVANGWSMYRWEKFWRRVE